MRPIRRPASTFVLLAIAAVAICVLGIAALRTKASLADSPRKLTVNALTFCSAIRDGLPAYDRWLRDPDGLSLSELQRRFGGEMLDSGQEIQMIEGGRSVSQVRIQRLRMLCYLPNRTLAAPGPGSNGADGTE